MDVVGLSFSVAQTILAALQCAELKDLFGSDLESLESSVKTILAVLRDADSKQAHGIELSTQERNFIEQIKDVVYDADDLLDAYATRAKLEQISMESGHKLSTKVRGLYSRFKHLAIASSEVKKVAKKLDKIGRDAQNFKFDSPPIRIRREETYSYVNENTIVGREEDHRRIVDMLLHPTIEGELPVLAIVGMGGLGKTSLAQLVYNDPKIQQEFSLRLWVCVSDEGGNKFNVKAILADIYKSATHQNGDMGIDLLVQKLRSKLDQQNYLLVLDDLWSEKRDECRKLVDILIGPIKRGSRIVVTTRSKKTANAIGSILPYELHGLSEDNSWRLFEMMVEREIKEGHDLFEICKDIVKKCVNVPLAIKVVGSLLWDVPENEWKSFQESRLIDIKNDDNDIMHILKFSYFHLSPSLKSCFTYCAIFLKDFEIPKEKLISMWMAHDYVKDGVEAEYHFQILVQRCFFQDIKENFNQEIVFKIHDLMHDMAQKVAGKEIYIANSGTTRLDKKIRHMNDRAPTTRTRGSVTPAKLRSYVQGDYIYMPSDSNIKFPVSTLIAKWKHLRVLDLHELGIRQLPDAIGEMLHLRYLNLYGNEELRMLPEALTKLINLQFLNLVGCSKLEEFPTDFKKLVNLRTLYVPLELEYMPLGMASMASLTRLNRFIVGHRQSCVKQEDKLEVLRGLVRNLRGFLHIDIKDDYKDAKEQSGEGGYICKTQHLNSITINWAVSVGNDEDVLEALQPHRNLKELSIWRYSGVRIPSWAREDNLTTYLPNLVQICLVRSTGLEELPWLGRLQHLKTLTLSNLYNVEYMENRRSIGEGSSSSRDDVDVAASNSSTILFFPSLEQLKLCYLPKLKGWWSRTPAHPFPSFPRLSKLSIWRCPDLMCIPPCPSLETLELTKLNPRFGVRIEEEVNSRSGFTKGGLPMVDFQCLVNMQIFLDGEVESVSEFEEVFCSCSSSLKSLKIEDCGKLKSVSEGGGLEYLTALEQLELRSLPELKFEEREEMPWRSLAQSLRSLQLSYLNKVDKLPKGMRYLTSLEYLYIYGVSLLKEIPEWIECLSSLQSLLINNCESLETLPRALKNLTSLKRFELYDSSEELYRRCEKPDGEYWPILEHIPQLKIHIWSR